MVTVGGEPAPEALVPTVSALAVALALMLSGAACGRGRDRIGQGRAPVGPDRLGQFAGDRRSPAG